MSLLVLLLFAAALPAGVGADEPNRAGLVVQYGDAQVETFCIAFEEGEITGNELLARSGLDVIADPATALGVRVCQIQDTGCALPAEHCFCQCMGGGECAYWNYYYRDPGEAVWIYSALGAAMRRVRPGSVEGWVWGDGQTPPASELSFDAICLPPTPAPTAEELLPVQTEIPEITDESPATATAEPTATPQPEERQAAKPTATVLPPTHTPVPSPGANTGQSLVSYWPFGLMVVCLLAAGAVVWLRRS